MRIFQKGFNYSQDGEGNRLVYHLQGCNMMCPWCSNPEGMKPEGVIVADEDWILESICPMHAIAGTRVDREICRNCQGKDCITRHNTKGMYLSYEEKTVREVVEEVLDSEMMFYDGGGVTFTGGEATLQFEELKDVLCKLHDRRIHTAIETNGSHRRLPELFPYIDQLIMDCKICDSRKHMKYTGISNETVLCNLKEAAASHPRLHVRVPLIGGVNDGKEDRREFLSLFRELKGDNVTFEILSYHEFGKKKWEQCGEEYKMTKEAYVSEAVLKEFKEAIIKSGARYQRT